jgi:hypothetical protein
MPLADTARPAQAAIYRWVLQAETDPQLPARILGIFTVRNELPQYFCARQIARDCVEIEIRAATGVGNDERARYLAARLLGIPSVIETRLWAPDGRALEI